MALKGDEIETAEGLGYQEVAQRQENGTKSSETGADNEK